MTRCSQQLRDRLAADEILVVPGAANALTARLIEQAGFEAAYVTGAGVSNTYLGVPDLGMLSLTEIASHVSAIRRVVDLPLIVDGDTGFGNAVNVVHTIRVLEQAGADAVQLEDQTFPKRCGHFAGKSVASAGEMVGKIKAAVHARRDDLLVVARTDALAIEGVDAAIKRAQAYRDAGADVLFVEAPKSVADMRRIADELEGPLLLNIVEGGSTPPLSQSELQAMGFSIALYANLPLLGAVAGVNSVLGALRQDRRPDADRVASWEQRQALVGLAEYDGLSERFGEQA